MPFGKGVFSIYFKPEFQDPVAMLAELSYKFSLIKRKKNDDGKMEFVLGSGKETVGTGCFDYAELGKYLLAQGKVKELAETVAKKIEGEGKTVPAQISEMKSGNMPSTPEVAIEPVAEEEKAGEEET